MRVAVIGAGITGLGAALALGSRADRAVTLFEKEPRLGGHAHTIDVEYDGARIAVDTGFIVYNELNYPLLTGLFRWAGVPTIASDMSFALSCGDGAFEWCGRDVSPLGGLFAQRRNAFNPAYLGFLDQVRRFQTRARADVAARRVGEGTLGEYIAAGGFSARLRDDYVAPMGAAIWSMTPGETLAFPAQAFLNFFENHKLLQWDRPVWRTVRGGSREYVRRLGDRLQATRAGAGAQSIRREGEEVVVRDVDGFERRFDAAIVATHAPTARGLLSDASDVEARALAPFRVSSNHVVVHRDLALMPRRKAAWGSWSVLRRDRTAKPGVTYWMNRLQSIPDATPLFVTLNPDRAIRSDLIFAEFRYDHPLYDAPALAAQSRLHEAQGVGRVWFAGAWTGYGFHEDGLRSGIEAARALGGEAPWLT